MIIAILDNTIIQLDENDIIQKAKCGDIHTIQTYNTGTGRIHTLCKSEDEALIDELFEAIRVDMWRQRNTRHIMLKLYTKSNNDRQEAGF